MTDHTEQPGGTDYWERRAAEAADKMMREMIASGAMTLVMVRPPQPGDALPASDPCEGGDVLGDEAGLTPQARLMVMLANLTPDNPFEHWDVSAQCDMADALLDMQRLVDTALYGRTWHDTLAAQLARVQAVIEKWPKKYSWDQRDYSSGVIDGRCWAREQVEVAMKGEMK